MYYLFIVAACMVWAMDAKKSWEVSLLVLCKALTISRGDKNIHTHILFWISQTAFSCASYEPITNRRKMADLLFWFIDILLKAIIFVAVVE